MERDLNSILFCKGCGVQLPEIQMNIQIGNPDYNEWCREGYCSFSCHNKNYDAQAHITPPPDRNEISRPQAQPVVSTLKASWERDMESVTLSGENKTTSKLPMKFLIAVCLAILTIFFGYLAYTVDPPRNSWTTKEGIVYLTTEQFAEMFRKILSPNDPYMKSIERSLSIVRTKRIIYLCISGLSLLFALIYIWLWHRDKEIEEKPFSDFSLLNK